MTWDRSKQTFWILRRGDPWKVMDAQTDKSVAFFPANCYHECIDKICFATNVDEVKEIIKDVLGEYKDGAWKWKTEEQQKDYDIAQALMRNF